MILYFPLRVFYTEQLERELEDAGFPGVTIWKDIDATCIAGEALTEGDHAAIGAVLAAHVPIFPPPARPDISRVDFALRMTPEERIAIRASVDPLVVDVRELLAMAERVDLTHPSTVGGVHLLEQLGILAPGRASEILGEAP